ncbi:hypothetical protein [Castellaniella sp.]|uniref:hypothetical protein n=1 Tax=Castellaniella sp. TaxID=1955812 RepID=UPI002AFE1DB3|nr:hypothetical protein [Castellaniella sp.]
MAASWKMNVQHALARVLTDHEMSASHRVSQHNPLENNIRHIVATVPTGDVETPIPSGWEEHYEERAAIAEYDGGLSRQEAEAFAQTEVIHLSRGKSLPTHPASCAGCGQADWLVNICDDMDRTYHVSCWRVAFALNHDGD